MSKKIPQRYYLKPYLLFLFKEIPGIIQIFSLPTIFGILLNRPWWAYLVGCLTGFFLGSYLIARTLVYLCNLMVTRDPFLNIKINSREEFIEYVKWWIVYILITGLFFALLSAVTILQINYNFSRN